MTRTALASWSRALPLVCVLACTPGGERRVDTDAAREAVPAEAASVPASVPASDSPDWRPLPAIEGCTFVTATHPERVEMPFTWIPCRDGTPGCTQMNASTALEWLEASSSGGDPWFMVKLVNASRHRRQVITTPDGPPAFVLEPTGDDPDYGPDYDPDYGCTVGEAGVAGDQVVVELRAGSNSPSERAIALGSLTNSSAGLHVGARMAPEPRVLIPRYSAVGDVVMVVGDGVFIRRSAPETGLFPRELYARTGFDSRFELVAGDGVIITTNDTDASILWVGGVGEPLLLRTIKRGGVSAVRQDAGHLVWIEWRGRVAAPTPGDSDRYRTVELYMAPLPTSADASLEPRLLATLSDADLQLGDRVVRSTHVSVQAGDGIVAYARPYSHPEPGIVLIDLETAGRRLLTMPRWAAAEPLLYVAAGELAYTQTQYDEHGTAQGSVTYRLQLDALASLGDRITTKDPARGNQ